MMWRLTLVALLWTLPAHAAGFLKIEEITTPQHITAWYVHDENVPVVALHFSLFGGAQMDDTGKEGTAEILSTLLDEGTTTQDAESFQNDLDRYGIKLRFGNGHDYFTGAIKTTTTFQDKAFVLLDKALNTPRFAPEAIERMRQGLLSQQRFLVEDPNWIAGTELFALLFPDHPYGRVIEGTPESLKAITRDDIVRMKDNLFCRGRLTVAVVGSLDKQQAAQSIDRVFGNWPECSTAERRPQITLPEKGLVKHIKRAGAQSVLVMAQQGLARQDPDWWAARILDFALGGGEFSSRLMSEIRVKRGYTYGIDSSLAPYRYAQIWLVQAGLDPKHRDDAIALVQKIWSDVTQQGLTKEEIKEAKAYLIGSMPLALTTTDQIASVLLQLQQDGLPMDTLDRREAEINAVTMDDIKRVAAKRLNADSLSVVTVGP